jgi:hypothetical protein
MERIDRIRQYETEIARLRAIEAEALEAREAINNGVIKGNFIPGEFRRLCQRTLESVRPELIRLEADYSKLLKTNV